jgi:hypothetical protein
MVDEKALAQPGVQNAGFRNPVGSKAFKALPRHVVLLTAPL